LNPSP